MVHFCSALKRTIYDFKNSFFPNFLLIYRAKYIFSRDMFYLYHFRAKIHGVKLFVLQRFIKSIFLPGIDPNGTAARNALPGTLPGSTPGVLLAAVRGYYKVVEVFKRYYSSNFLLENKFQQMILHIFGRLTLPPLKI